MLKPVFVIIFILALINVSFIQTIIIRLSEIVELPDDLSFPINNAEEEQESSFSIKPIEILPDDQIRNKKNIFSKQNHFTFNSIALMLPFLSVETPPPNFIGNKA